MCTKYISHTNAKQGHCLTDSKLHNQFTAKSDKKKENSLNSNKKPTSNSVFRENRCPPTKFSVFSTAVTLKIKSRSPNSNQFFVMLQLYIHENLIQPLVPKILCRHGSVMLMPTLMPTESTPKTICPAPLRGSAIKMLL